MAGTYPDVPGYRFAYDQDGTIITVSQNDGAGNIYYLSSAQTTLLNGNNGVNYAYVSVNFSGVRYSNYLSLFFPEARNITGYYMAYCTNPGWSTQGMNASFQKIETSTDATNPQNGTWTTQINPYVYSNVSNISPSYRASIQSVNWPSINCIRISAGQAPLAFHLYGSIATTESPDRLRIVDMSDNDIAAQLDFGDIPQRNNATKQFKVVNNSSTMTANNITITMDTNPDASPSLIGQYQLSTDNTAFANAINIGTLAPGASSATLYIRDTIANTAQLGPWSARLIASANTWS